MATRMYCDRQICNKEILGRAYRLRLPLNKESDLCEDCSKEFEGWLYKEPDKEDGQ